MILFCRSKKLLFSAFRCKVLPEYTGFCKSYSSVSKACCDSLFLPRCSTPYLFSRSHDKISQHLVAKRFYSEVFSEHDPCKNTGRLRESPETDNDHRDLGQSSPESFTLDVLVSLLRQENAADICVINVPEHIKYTEYFIVVSGVSPRHLRAMALYAIKVYKFLKKESEPNVKIEGKNAEDWMCIDFGNMVCHFMLPEIREVYELEKLWTLRNFDEQLKNMPAETLPEDFIYDAEVTK